MRYVLLLLIFCITFGVLDSVPRERTVASASPIHRWTTATPAPATAAPVMASETGYVRATVKAVVAKRFFKVHQATLIAVAPPAVAFATPGRPPAASARPAARMAAPHAPKGVSEDLAHGIVEPGELALGATPGSTAGFVPDAPGAPGASSVSRASTVFRASNAYSAPGASRVSDATEKAKDAGGTLAAETVADGSVPVEPAIGLGSADAPEGERTRLTGADLVLREVSLNEAAVNAPSLRDFALAAKDQTGTPFFRDTIRNLLMNPKGVQFGGIAGLNWSGASAAGTTGKVGGKALTGLTLGIFADVPLKKHLSIRPRTQYAYEGYQPDVNGQRVNIHVAYLHMSSNLVYHTEWLRKRFFVSAGPYMAYAMNGTYTLKGINADMAFGNNYAAGDNLRKMDYGASLTSGLLMDRNFILEAGLDWGLHDIAPGGSATRIHTRSAGVTIMYVFGSRPLF